MSRIAKSGHLVAVPEPVERPLVRLRRARYGRTVARGFSSFIQKQPKPLLMGAAVVLIGLVGLLDYATGTQFSFLPFYILPVALVTWYVSKRAGVLASVLSVGAWIAAYFAVDPDRWDIGVTYWNAAMRGTVFLIVALALAEMRRALDREKELARTDLITAAGNSRAFRERVEQTIFYARRYSRPFTGAYIDVDNFKAVNDHYGHSTGDFCLRIIADTIRRNSRNTDFVARIGGDEFALLMPETNQEQARVVVTRVREKLLEEMRHNGWPATFSIGSVTYASAPETADDLLKAADDLMYSVKNGGKNDIRFEVHGEVPPGKSDARRAAS